MGTFGKGRFVSNNQSWETPIELFKQIDAMFNFTRDVCATEQNKKVQCFWSEQDSCLEKEKWDGVNWMNPPFKNMKDFIKKAYEQKDNAITVCLIPARTNTKWWHDYCMKGEIYFIEGRPKFGDAEHGLPQPLALVVFGKQQGIMHSFHYKTQKDKTK